MMTTIKMKLAVLICCLLPIGLLQSCSEKEVPEASKKTPTILAADGCPDEVANNWEWEVMPSTPPPPYDVTLHAYGTMPNPDEYAANGVVCDCEEEKICILFNFSQPQSPGYSLMITMVNGTNMTQTVAQPNSQGGYIGFPTPPQLASALSQLYGQPVTPADLVFINKICIPVNLGEGEIFIDVDFDGDEPADYDAEAIIKNVIGLCIVDNLGDPNHQ